MWGRLAALIVKEFLAIWRDKKSRAILIVPPFVQLVLFSYAATFDVNNATLAVFNEDIGSQGRELVARFTGSPAFRLVATLTRVGEIRPLVEAGKAVIVLHIGPEFSRRLARGQSGPVQVILDGRRSNNALVILGYARQIIETFAEERARAQGLTGPPARVIARAWFNPNLSSQWFIVPALIALLTMLVATVMTALSVARERELGTLAQLLVTPLRPVEIMIGKIVPAMVLGLAEGTVIVVFALWWFRVPLLGSLWLLYLGVGVFLISVVGVGLMISSLAKTQQQAVFGAFLFFVPAVLLSGFASPIESMSPWVQYVTLIDPMRYVLVLIRGIFLQGLSPALAIAQIWPMAVIGVISLGLATVLFRRRLY